MTKRTRAKQIIVEIIRAAGGEFQGKTRLYKAFYFTHLYYYRDASDLLSDWPIVHMPYGPGIDQGAALLDELVSAGQIEKHAIEVGPYQEDSFTLLGNPPCSLNQNALEAIAKTVALIRDKSATELSDMLHDKSVSWTESHDGQEINPYIDVIPESERIQTRRRLEGIERQVAAVFRG